MADFLSFLAVVGYLAAVAAGSVPLARLIQGSRGLPDFHRTISRGGLLVAAACTSFIGMAALLPSL